MEYHYTCKDCGEKTAETLIDQKSADNQYCVTGLCRKCFHVLVAAKIQERKQGVMT